jgi:predicted dehydrogenase
MRILVVGLGSIGQRHVRNLRQLFGSDVHISACRMLRRSPVLTDGLDVESGANVESRYSIRAYSDLPSAIAARPDAVFICNPTSMHLEAASLAAEAGCHLFVEKPLASSWEGVEDLVRLVERKGLVGLVGYQMRFHPCLRLLGSLLAARPVGRILSVRIEVAEYLPSWHPYEDYRQAHSASRRMGGGAVLEQSHELDYACWLFGFPRRIFSIGGHLGSLEVEAEDTASTLMECVVDGRPIPVHLSQDFARRAPSRICEVIGEEGKIAVDLRALTVTVVGGDGRAVQSQSFEGFDRNQMFLDELEHFLACVRGEAEPIVSLRDGTHSLRMALAILESLETGRVVDLRQHASCGS